MRRHFPTFVLAAATAAALLAGPLAPPSGADAAADEADAKARIAYFDKYAGKAKDDHKYSELVMDLVGAPHPLTADRIGRILNADPDEEHKLIAAMALGDFKKPEAARLAAGKQLHTAVEKGKISTDVKDSAVDAIGRLKYVDSCLLLCEILRKGDDPWLLVTTVRAVGRLDDWRALPTLLELWERSPVGYSWETGEVKVDTGASGDTDQKAAEAAWQAKYGNKVGGKGKPPVMLKAYIQELVRSVRLITDDETIEVPSQLRRWMEDRREELKKLGIDVPKKKNGTRDEEEKDKAKDKDPAKGPPADKPKQ